MSEQTALFSEPTTAAAPKLKGRQQAVYDLLAQRGRDGATAAEAGALLHAQAGKHPADQPCRWDAQNGRQVLQALHRKGLVRQVRDRTGRWVLRDLGGAVDERYPSYNGPIPF